MFRLVQLNEDRLHEIIHKDPLLTTRELALQVECYHDTVTYLTRWIRSKNSLNETNKLQCASPECSWTQCTIS